jgi:hypothetical protein
VNWPHVTCLCPTYGRFARLREAVACFLEQDYPGPCQLLIADDGPEPITLTLALAARRVLYTHTARPFENLGTKRQRLLDYMVGQPGRQVAAHWDDDDLYLPHHLTRSVRALLERKAGCVKSRGAWYMKGAAPSVTMRGPVHNALEGSMVFWAREAERLGGYPPKHSGQAKALMRAFAENGRLYKIPDDEGAQEGGAASQISYVYRWGQGVGHISAMGNHENTLERFQRGNQDFGDGQPLTPADLSHYWQLLEVGTHKRVPDIEEAYT